MTGSGGAIKVALTMGALLLALTSVLSSCGGVGTTASTPQSTTAKTAAHRDTPTSSEAANRPAIGDVITLRSMTAARIPTGKLIEMLESDSGGVDDLRLVIDPNAHKGFREMAERNAPYPGFDYMVFDDGGHREMGSVSLQLDPYGGANFTDIIKLYDNLQGQSVKVVSHEALDGQQTFVVKTTLSGEGVTTDVKANVDPATGLVVQENWKWDTSTRTITRRIIDATPELLNRMDIKAMDDIVAAYREQRAKGLKDFPFPVYGLPTGYRGLSLFWTITAPNNSQVRLQYMGPASVNNITVTTIDPKKYPGYAKKYLMPLDQASVEGAENVAELRFGIGDVGVQIQARSDIIKQVARDLIVVGGPGS